ncbi:N-acetylmuramoyl-L-alanine amidase [Heyndrickxia oleronia]|uniref:N-acetylmuramoyl-L-alanine amidase family protein n=2 Tax=Heyndrickxia oleronia TaxID=38875 RepID=UPI00204102BA|nr:N-acetylmuramoyl-L-alanine amidase [Heyndrickxia oleronia]MCM3452718.1 N-acetylmuramoyl-L-alanine amidase [Heyndrickxia oleronia]
MKIAIDAGHGKNTPGKRTPDNSLHEWEFNSGVVTKLINKLNTCENVSILRTDDPTGKIDVSLKSRTDKANKWGADVFYSQHGNAAYSTWNSANGLETFVYTSWPKDSLAFAKVVQEYVVKATGLRDRGVKAKDLHVLRETNMTAILQEGPFMSNKEEAELLKSEEFREKYAEAVFQAFVSHFKLIIKEESKSNVKDESKVGKKISFYTGGYSGESLIKIHNFLIQKGYYYKPTRNDGGSLSFEIGQFTEGTPKAKEMENFLKGINAWYQIK